MTDVTFEDLKGKTLKSVLMVRDVNGEDDTITFTTTSGEVYQSLHYQDCCEYVYIQDVCGDLGDIIDSPILVAEEVESTDTPEGVEASDESNTWTFYKLDTEKGGVVIRWCGESNGYYSESVDFIQVKADE